MKEELFSFLDTQSKYVIELQSEMTKIIAIGPDNQGNGESEKATYLHSELAKLEISDIIEINAPDPRVSSGVRPNIAAKIAGKSAKTLWIMGHMDVVPAGELKLWKSNPFELMQEGDILIGRGVEDNQQAIASAMLVAKALKEKNIIPDLTLGILLLSDEETHSSYGLGYIVATMPDLIKADDLVLIPDFGNDQGDMIEIAEKSCMWVKVTITGKQCHASTPEAGINTLLASSACVLELQKLHELFPQEEAIFMPPRSTFVPTKKEANVENINTVPGQDIFYLDYRLLPGIDPAEVLEKTKELAERAVTQYGATVSVESVFIEKAPAPTSADSPVVKKLAASLKRLRRIEGKATGVGGQTVAAVLRHKDIPAVAWCTVLQNAHTPNEKSSIKNTIADAKVMLDMLFE